MLVQASLAVHLPSKTADHPDQREHMPLLQAVLDTDNEVQTDITLSFAYCAFMQAFLAVPLPGSQALQGRRAAPRASTQQDALHHQVMNPDCTFLCLWGLTILLCKCRANLHKTVKCILIAASAYTADEAASEYRGCCYDA